MNTQQQTLNQATTQLHKALAHFEYSLNKIKQLSHKTAILNDDNLQIWEGFSARFARVSDLFLARYIRTRLLLEDPGFRGSFRDHLLQAEKLGIIDNHVTWLKVRELRNVTAHEYSEDNLNEFFLQLKELAPTILTIKEII